MTRSVPSLVTAAEVREAARGLGGRIRRTPLLEEAWGSSDPAGGRVWLKCENLQGGGAFKLRGATWFLSRLAPETRAAGVVTYSSGNHAQGVARAARAFGVQARIVMPVDAPELKWSATKALGARLERAGRTTTERRARAEELLARHGGTMVPPFDHPWIIAGQGTVGLEIEEQLREQRAARGGAADAPGPPRLVLVPVGGGGLIAGVAAYLRETVPDARVVGVEAEGAPKMSRSLAAGEPVTLERIDTIADGLKPVRPGDLTFEHCRELAEDVVTVPDEAIREAVLWCLDRRLLVEPSGAVGIAALATGRVAPAADGETVVVLSGGNLDPALLRRWLAARAGEPAAGDPGTPAGAGARGGAPAEDRLPPADSLR